MTLGYVVGPLSLGVLILFRSYGLVAALPIWAYLTAIAGAVASWVIVEPWHSLPPGRSNGTRGLPSGFWRSVWSST